jgi:hypothetical protein
LGRMVRITNNHQIYTLDTLITRYPYNHQRSFQQIGGLEPPHWIRTWPMLAASAEQDSKHGGFTIAKKKG